MHGESILCNSTILTGDLVTETSKTKAFSSPSSLVTWLQKHRLQKPRLFFHHHRHWWLGYRNIDFKNQGFFFHHHHHWWLGYRNRLQKPRLFFTSPSSLVTWLQKHKTWKTKTFFFTSPSSLVTWLQKHKTWKTKTFFFTSPSSLVTWLQKHKTWKTKTFFFLHHHPRWWLGYRNIRLEKPRLSHHTNLFWISLTHMVCGFSRWATCACLLLRPALLLDVSDLLQYSLQVSSSQNSRDIASLQRALLAARKREEDQKRLIVQIQNQKKQVADQRNCLVEVAQNLESAQTTPSVSVRCCPRSEACHRGFLWVIQFPSLLHRLIVQPIQ